MAVGTIEHATVDLGSGGVAALATELNTLFSGNRVLLHTALKDTSPRSTRLKLSPRVRLLYEVVGASGAAGKAYIAQAFAGNQAAVVSAFAAYSIANPTYLPERIFDFSGSRNGRTELVVLFSDLSANAYGGLAPKDMRLAQAGEEIAAGATGSVSFLDGDGNTVGPSATVRNAHTATAIPNGQTTYVVMDPNSNQLLALPMGCGGGVAGAGVETVSAQGLQIFRLRGTNADGELAISVAQWFEIHPNITVRDASLLIDDSQGSPIYQLCLLYDSNGGCRYGAEIFMTGEDGVSADGESIGFFINNPNALAWRTWSITSALERRGSTTKLFVLWLEKDRAYQARTMRHFAGQAAEDIAALGSGNVKQVSAVATHPSQLEATNLGSAGAWVSQAGGLIVADQLGKFSAVSCCGAAGTDDVETIPANPTGAVCVGVGPPSYPPPGEPSDPADSGGPPVDGGGVGGGGSVTYQKGCLWVEHECQCINDVDVWVATTISCVNNSICGASSIVCDNQNSVSKTLNACYIGFVPPAVVGDPPCAPVCCPDTDPPPSEGDCCLEAIYDCTCEEVSDGPDEPVWTLTSVTCLDNADCDNSLSYTEDDLDGDDVIDHVEYQEEDACSCGETDEDTLLALLPDTYFKTNADGDVVPIIEADCCPSLCCVKLSYICVENSDGESEWEFDSAECVDNDDCSSSGTDPEEAVRTCDDGLSFEVTLRDACDCDDIGTLDQDTAEEAIPDEPQDCDADCVDRDCVYEWESEWDCDTQDWKSPVLVSKECVASGSGTASDWDYDPDRDCYALKTTVVEDCGCVSDTDCPEP